MQLGRSIFFSFLVSAGPMNCAIKKKMKGRLIARPPRKQTCMSTEKMPIGLVVTRPWRAEELLPTAVRRG